MVRMMCGKMNVVQTDQGEFTVHKLKYRQRVLIAGVFFTIVLSFSGCAQYGESQVEQLAFPVMDYEKFYSNEGKDIFVTSTHFSGKLYYDGCIRLTPYRDPGQSYAIIWPQGSELTVRNTNELELVLGDDFRTGKRPDKGHALVGQHVEGYGFVNITSAVHDNAEWRKNVFLPPLPQCPAPYVVIEAISNDQDSIGEELTDP